MQQIHIEAARQALKHAMAANLDMRKATDDKNFFRHWSSFLTELNTVYNQLHHGVKQGQSAYEKVWNEQIKAERYSDPLLRYITIARQVKDKTATMTVELIPPTFSGISLVPLGSSVPFAQIGMSTDWRINPLPVVSGGKLANPPDQHKGKLLLTEWQCVSWWDVLDVATGSVNQMISEARARFVQGCPASN